MAKIVLYATARYTDKQAIEQAQIFIDACPTLDDFHPTLSLMVPLADDPFASIPGVQHDAPTFALEIALPFGQLLEPLLAQLQPQIDRLLDHVQRDTTQVLAGHHRAFKVNGRNKLIYHYLMQRKAGFRTADYLDYYTNNHYQFGIATPGIDYYQTYKDAELTTDLARRWGIAAATAENISEMHMNDIGDLLGNAATAEVGGRATADEDVFVDRAKSRMFTMQLIGRRFL